MRRRWIGAAALAWLMAAAISPGGSAAPALWLDTLDLRGMRQDWGQAQRNRSVQGNPITIAGRRFARGVGTHANSAFTLPCRGATRFTAWVGVDDEMRGHPGSVEFQVFGDGKLLWRSGILRVGTPAVRADVPLQGVWIARLVVTDAGDGIDSDHADWAEARFEGLSRADTTSLILGSEAAAPTIVRPKWEALHADANALGAGMRMGGRTFGIGLGVRGGTDLIFRGLAGRYKTFTATVGVDEATRSSGHVRFVAFVDGRKCAETGPMRAGSPPVDLRVPVHGADELRLVAAGPADVLANWANALLTAAPSGAAPVTRVAEGPGSAAPAYVVRSPALAVELSREGEIVGLRLPGRSGAHYAMRGATQLAGCLRSGDIASRRLSGGGVEFVRRVKDPVTGKQCMLAEQFAPTKTSVRWNAQIRGTAGPWSTAIETAIRWPATSATRFWTAWADSRGALAEGWSDPCQTAPMSDATLCYGAPLFKPRNPLTGYIPARYDVTAIPMACFLEPGRDLGVSVALSPADPLLDMTVRTTRAGAVVFSRLNNRIAADRPVSFTVDLVPHAADWRPALAWMTSRYPRYFDPTVPAANEIAGTAAYSTYQGELDVAKLRRMAFRVNWQASYEFPYFGMFLPPCPPDEEWVNTRGVRTSQNSLNAYYERMRALDFYVLSYFNVTEFGTHLRIPPPSTPPPSPLWKDGTAFLFARLEDAILLDADGRPIPSWEGSVAMDPGAPAYADFLCEQARRHVERTPATSGICIDRMDWLRYYNTHRNDGLTWFDGGPARSLLNSWRAIIARIAPIMHDAGKVIYVNNHIKRLDTLEHIDGFYDEFGHLPPSFNLTALLAVHRPYLAWTPDVNTLRPDPDAYMQRHLHLGAFPTAPYPGNDHTILPDPWAEGIYEDYGPLLDTLRGRKWVLRAHAVEVAGHAALANLFSSPGGYVVPVTFGARNREVTVVLRGLPELEAGLVPRASALRPGVAGAQQVVVRRVGAKLLLRVPLVRGCAVVRLIFGEGDR